MVLWPPTAGGLSQSHERPQWTGALRNAAFFAYADNYLMDVKRGSSWMSKFHARSGRPRSAQPMIELASASSPNGSPLTAPTARPLT
jgi:hypothetical protein